MPTESPIALGFWDSTEEFFSDYYVYGAACGLGLILLCCWCCRTRKATKEVTLRWSKAKETPFGPEAPESPSAVIGGIDYQESDPDLKLNVENELESELRKTRLKVALQKEKLKLQELQGIDPDNEGKPAARMNTANLLGGEGEPGIALPAGGTAGMFLDAPRLNPDAVSGASDELEFITPRGGPGVGGPLNLQRMPVRSMTQEDGEAGEGFTEVYETDDSEHDEIPKPAAVRRSDSLFKGATGTQRRRVGEGGNGSTSRSSGEDKRSSGSSSNTKPVDDDAPIVIISSPNAKTQKVTSLSGLLTPPDKEIVGSETSELFKPGLSSEDADSGRPGRGGGLGLPKPKKTTRGRGVTAERPKTLEEAERTEYESKAAEVVIDDLPKGDLPDAIFSQDDDEIIRLGNQPHLGQDDLPGELSTYGLNL